MKEIPLQLDEGAILPVRATVGSAGYDLSLRTAVTLKPGKCVMADTGVHVEIPKGNVGLVFIRSSIGSKRHVGLANSVGVIDSDYRGSIGLPLHNFGDDTQNFEIGERVAQLIIVPCLMSVSREVSELADSERGHGGFGSTGAK